METFLQLIAELQAVVNKMSEQSADFPAQLEAVRAEGFEAGRMSREQEIMDLIAAKEAEKMAFGAAEYARGFADGGSGVISDKIYSQAELDAAVAAATGPLNESVLLLQGRVAELEAMVAGFDAKIGEVVAAAVAQVKADILARYDAAQADDAAFRDSLL